MEFYKKQNLICKIKYTANFFFGIGISILIVFGIYLIINKFELKWLGILLLVLFSKSLFLALIQLPYEIIALYRIWTSLIPDILYKDYTHLRSIGKMKWIIIKHNEKEDL